MAVQRWQFPFRSLRRHVANPSALAMTVAGAVSLLIAGVLSYVDTPSPVIHDEFSYLLAADTFLNGRLTNPPHPCWRHFESFHIIQQPTYASKYQPVPGFLLAIGIKVVGHPIAGVCLGTALMAICGCWMLRGWLPNRWALFGSLLIALHPSFQFVWGQGYWGGAVPFIGGALLFGAWPRIRASQRAGDAVILGLGLAILAGSRPFEGCLAGCCVLVSMLAWMVGKNRPGFGRFMINVAVPCGLVLTLFAAFMAYYNQQVTGSPWKLPYAVHEATYGVSPLFVCQTVKPMPEYQHAAMQNYFTNWGLRDFQEQQSFVGWLNASGRGLLGHARFYLGYLIVPLLTAVLFVRKPRLRLAWMAVIVALLANSMVPWKIPHYLAPVAPLMFLLIVNGLRYLRILARRTMVGNWIAPTVLTFQAFACIGLMQAHSKHDPLPWCQVRDKMERQLAAEPGKDLILVHYSDQHNQLQYRDPRIHFEWVYNRANIDEAEVVWARSIDTASDRRLAEYFADRQIWHFWPDRSYELKAVCALKGRVQNATVRKQSTNR
jgi:hypothetical protein